MEYNMTSEVFLANDRYLPEQSTHAHSTPRDVTRPMADRRDMMHKPELSRLVKLRDALLVLKGSMSPSADLHQLLERQLLSNDVHDRVLGKLADSGACLVS